MSNRRNYYRILRVQPDASVEVIRRSYRTLLQSLRLHPDLGGDHRDASVLNEAWSVLRDPERRARYDVDLMARYGMDVLSLGAVCPGHRGGVSEGRDRRHHYRLLEVQTDAPAKVIEASWKILRAHPGADVDALDAAWETLRDPDARDAYDRLLSGETTALVLPFAQAAPAPVVEVVADAPPPAYEPVITIYCPFCKTPARMQRSPWSSDGCFECASPLTHAGEVAGAPGARAIERLPQRGRLTYFVDWPGRPLAGELRDLSISGARFLIDLALPTGLVIKMDAERFAAIAAVSHQRRDGGRRATGVQFITVRFEQPRGGFVSEVA